MKIAIIGGGFYGIMASLEAAANKYVDEVTIFEKNDSLMLAAGKYNQARLHLGFHYPRSEETIRQTKSGFVSYQKRFPNATQSINKNIYLIREDGLISIEQYLQVMQKNKIKFKDIDVKETSFKYRADGIDFKTIQVEERYIDILKLNQDLFREIDEMGINVCLGQEVKYVDTENGILEFYNNKTLQYDLIVNCSYINPFIGFSENKIPLKYEFCTLLFISSEVIKNQAITVMDGPFVSIYPWLSNLHSVASVKFSPALQNENLKELINQRNNMTFSEIEKINFLIEDHMRSLFEFDYDLIGSFSTIKVKRKEDIGDKRIVKTFSEGRCLSVLQGKLDAVDFFLSDLSALINKVR